MPVECSIKGEYVLLDCQNRVSYGHLQVENT